MYDQRVTINEAVRQIQSQNYLLPAIQREIVWERDQITDLFDSVLQGYPIGTFLYWDLEDENRDEYTMYGFIQHYITDTKYIETDAQSRNSKVTPDGAGDLKLILDGQQRLSSFYIGLRGTYTYKQRYKWYRNEDAWNRSQLYFKLTSDPREQVDSGGDRQTRYEFQFLPQDDYGDQLIRRGDDYWFRTGRILDYPDRNDVEDYIYELKDRLDLTSDEERWAGQNLRDLRAAIHDQKYITYFEEKEQDIDRVLEIFIRTNDGGTQLQKSDLLLSIAQANWQKHDAREELTSFVDHLNTQLPKTNGYDKDFLLKSSLVLSDLTVRYQVSQFKRENVSLIEEEWPQIKRSIKEAATLVNHFGIGEKTLLSQNAVIPIAYYFKETGLAAEDFLTDNSELSRIRRDIRRWFITSLLNGTLSGSADTVLTRIREVLQEEDGEAFPIGRINEEMRSLGKVIGFSEEIAENVLERTKGGSRTFLALTLLYDREDFGSIRYHQDHIFPKSRLTTEKLIEKGIDPEPASTFEDDADKLPNVQLLTRTENESKQDTPFEEWITQQSPSFYDRHLIPRDPDLHRVENFDRFLETRREEIKSKLMSILSASSDR
ncbi:GmrSD restriction endonuclease domain-containing protein [Salinibacter ruber]|uniref:Uncharacterized protein with ParB-like and HNH nuclease domain n=1 Tax=Salinibacter ruber TaxID=146919 RepID=A0A9X2UB68_9BACT|nr:DUF262 domain-containing protein [Salinibacter ruber]MCS3953095.1 uncharacterized protein with ParB-like and HNH nuclease domain [Salinibacter ruber]